MLFGTSGLFVLARGRFPRGGGAVRGRTATWGGLAQRLIASYAVAVPAAMRRLGAALASDQTRVPAHFVCSGTMGRSLVKRRLRFRPVSQAWRLPAMLGVLGLFRLRHQRSAVLTPHCRQPGLAACPGAARHSACRARVEGFSGPPSPDLSRAGSQRATARSIGMLESSGLSRV